MSLRFTEEEFKNFMSQRTARKGSPKKPAAAPREKEIDIQNEIRDMLRMHGWFVMRHQQSLGSLKGLSDLTAIRDGKTVYIEVKTSRGKQSAYQEAFQKEIESHGGTYILARKIEDIEFLCRDVKQSTTPTYKGKSLRGQALIE